MDLKHLYVKVEKLFEVLKDNKDIEIQKKATIDKIFNLLYPLIETFPKMKGYFNDDLIQDFTIYIYQRLEFIVKKYSYKGKFINYFYTVLTNNFFNFMRINHKHYQNEKLTIDSVTNAVMDSTHIYFSLVDKGEMSELEKVEEEKYKNLIDSILNILDDFEKVLFLLYNYEVINGKWLIFIARYLNKTPIEVNKIILKFREKNINKYKRKELLCQRLLKSNSVEKSQQYKKELEAVLFYGDLNIISGILNISNAAIKSRLFRIKNKIKKSNFNF